MYCADDEWCIGATDITNATYLVASLCVKGNMKRDNLRFAIQSALKSWLISVKTNSYDIWIISIVNVSCGADMRAPGCKFCPQKVDEGNCNMTQGCDHGLDNSNDWCDGDCYLDNIEGLCKELSTLQFHYLYSFD